MLLPTVYEDAGISGGTLERPGLQRLLADIDAGLVEQIVVYKVDRLTRSLSDFAKLVERLRGGRRGFCLGDPVLQHRDQHGTTDVAHAAVLRAIRAGGHGRADPR